MPVEGFVQTGERLSHEAPCTTNWCGRSGRGDPPL